MRKLITAVKGLALITAIVLVVVMLTTARDVYRTIEHANKVLAAPAPTPVERRETDWSELLDQKAHKYGVPVGMLWVLFNHESSGGKRNYRFEPGKMDVALRITKDVNEARMLASSHCPFHVMGTTARQYGSTWEKISKSDDECADVAAHYMADALEHCAGKGIAEQVYCSFRAYNGGFSAKGQDSADYAANRSAEFFNQLLSDLFPNGIRVSDNG